MVRTLGPRKAHRELVLTNKRGCQRTAPIFPTPVVELPVSDSPVRVANVANFPNFVHQVPKGGLYQHNIAW